MKKILWKREHQSLSTTLKRSAIAVFLGNALALQSCREGPEEPRTDAHTAPTAISPQEKDADFQRNVDEDVKIVALAPKPFSPDFSRFNSIITQPLKKPGAAICPRPIGSEAEVRKFLWDAKLRLDAAGISIASEAAGPEDVFRAIHSYYLDNNMWVILAKMDMTRKGERSKVACFNQYRILESFSASVSLFDGRLSVSGAPVRFVDGPPMLYGDSPLGGVTIKSGVIIFPGVFKSGPSEYLKNDVVIHEVIHYIDIRGDNLETVNEYDFDPSRFGRENVPNAARSEFRAYLGQLAYGKDPKRTLDVLLHSTNPQYRLAKNQIGISLEDYAKSRGIRWEEARAKLSDNDIRAVARDLFLSNFP